MLPAANEYFTMVSLNTPLNPRKNNPYEANYLYPPPYSD